MKKILSLLLSMMMVFSVAGCDQKAQASVEKPQQQVEQTAKKEQETPKAQIKNEIKEDTDSKLAEQKNDAKPNTQNIKKESIPKANKNLKKEQVIKKALEKSDKIKSVEAQYQVKVVQLDNNKKDTKNQNNVDIFTKVIYSNEKEKNGLRKVSKMYDNTNIDNQKSEAYVDFEKNKIYLNEDGKGLKEYKKDDVKPQTSSGYDAVLKVFAMVANNMKMTETDTTYNFTYKSNLSNPKAKEINGEMIYKLDAPFGMGISLKHLDEIDANITYKISKKDFTLVSIEEQFLQTVDGQHYRSTGKFTLKSVDKIKDIEEAKKIK